MRGRLSVLFLALLALVLVGGGCFLPAASSTAVLNLYDIDPHTLDPAVAGDMTSHGYIAQIFSGLVKLDDSMNPVPDIASGWQVSPDGKTYTFTLRQDVKFQDGRQVKAADFKYSWERACLPATGSQTAPTYLSDIAGAADVLSGKTAQISGIRVVDDFTLEVTITAPRSYFLARLTYPVSFVVDKATVEKGGEWWRQPNGTGPFKLKTWQEGSLVVLTKNDGYYGEQARLGEVDFHLWSGIPMSLYESDQIDVAGVGGGNIDRVTDPAGPFAGQLVTTPEMSIGYIGFNFTKSPFDDINVRRAFAAAIDKDKIVKLVYRDTVQRADGIVPPGMPGYEAKVAGFPFDPAKAKAYIQASRYRDVSKLPPITLTTGGYGGAISGLLEAVIAEWRQNLGVEVTVRQLEPERSLYYLKEEKDELWDMGWVADYAHPQDFLDVLFRTGAENNFGEYSSPAVDALLDRANAELDSPAGNALYEQAEQKLIDEVACIPIVFGKNYTLVKPYVKGYKLNPMGLAMLNRVSIEPH